MSDNPKMDLALGNPSLNWEATSERLYAAGCAIERELAEALEALTQIRSNTNADDPESYRADDREGCLDTVFSIADKVLAERSKAK